MGVDLVVVDNGRQAVDAFALGGFDLILMDVQMPVMDGLQATRQIRALGGHAAAVAIVALTANAMRSDQNACLDAGMDDFVSKPLDPDDFLNTVHRFVGEDHREAEGAVMADGGVPDLDESQLDGLTRLMPTARLRTIIEGFLLTGQSRLQRIEGCAAASDMVGLAREAHDLKGLCGNVGARRLQQLCDRLEQAAKASDQPGAVSLTAEVRRASITAWDLIGRQLANFGEPDRDVA